MGLFYVIIGTEVTELIAGGTIRLPAEGTGDTYEEVDKFTCDTFVKEGSVPVY